MTEEAVISRSETGVGRAVTLAIDEAIWVNFERPTPPNSFEMTTVPWLLVEGCDEMVVPILDPASPRLEVGGRYTIALVLYVLAGQGWGPLSPSSVLAVPGDEIAEQDVEARGHSEVASFLAGMTTAEIRDHLDATDAYPEASANGSLPAEHRLRLVFDIDIE